MKKSLVILLTGFALFALGACGSNQDKSTKESSETSMSSQEQQSDDSQSNEQSESIFTATLTEDAVKNDTVDQSIRLVLDDVKAEEDPDEILNSFKNDGVILNVAEDQFADGTTEETLKKGDQVRFTLKANSIMTMSIPPQIPGNSIVKVEKI